MGADNLEPAATKILTAREAQVLEAVAERIFPPTDTPGAVEIGVVEYIEVALAGDYAALLPLYRRGLRALDRYSASRHGREFLALNDETKDAVLLAFDSGAVPEYRNAAEFFETVRYHVMEGVFCEPHYGGNRDMIGWRLVGFPGQQFGYPNAYINRPVDLEPIAAPSRKSEKKAHD